ncbi:MAG: PLP-dependent transferase [Calditrichaeota bacterium]|nr:MAG: PLP-dependent transferase [Calditrichota bacterium]MBL1207264.1 PLP-dependent transferase [Calditrichota bacterium]NOG47097.1 PLP-dependent transferase [Calditrichota bacterium]
MEKQNKSIYTLAVHAGENPEKHLGAVNTPLYNSSVFIFPNAERGAQIHEGEVDGYFYGRMGNPTQSAIEQAMCELEGGEAALSFASGMSAISSLLFSVLKPNDHIIIPKSIYATTHQLFKQLLNKYGISVTFIDATNADNYHKALNKNTKAFYLETPSNPILSLIDIKAVTDIAKANNILTIADNTFATPFNQNPIDLGVDVVAHSATKFLGGHSDLMAGVLVGSQKIINNIRWNTSKILGGTISPHSASLLLRGLKTFALRMERHNSNALTIASFLYSHPKIKKVYYPGLPSNAQNQLAKKQMYGYGGIVSFDVGGVEAGRRLINNLELCSLAVSLGDVATLIQHSASMTHASVSEDERNKSGITDGLIRLSVGIENVNDIKEDLNFGLSFI